MHIGATGFVVERVSSSVLLASLRSGCTVHRFTAAQQNISDCCHFRLGSDMPDAWNLSNGESMANHGHDKTLR